MNGAAGARGGLGLLLGLMLAVTIRAAPYAEKYRPQYHFTPR